MNNADQVEYWNGPAGQKWVDQSNRLDAMLAPFADTVIAKAGLKPDERVMDIGCGAGALTLRAASRFGVMFFEDPAAAFAKIRQSVKPGGRLAFICWQGLSVNDWALAPLQAAMPFFKETPAPADPTAPGPFAFQDKDRVVGILSDAGWANVAIDPVETTITLPGEDVATTARFLMQDHTTPEGRIAMKSACWIVSGDNA